MQKENVAEKLQAIVRRQFSAQLQQNKCPSGLTSLAYSTDP